MNKEILRQIHLKYKFSNLMHKFTTAAASLRPQQHTVNKENNQFYETTTPLILGSITQVSNIIKGLNNNSANEPDDVSA
jgi:hypothetical protein